MGGRVIALGVAAVAYVLGSQWMMTRAPTSSWSALAIVGPMLALAAFLAWQRGQRLLAQVIGAFTQQDERLVAQLGESDAAVTISQGVTARHGEQQFLLEQRQRLQRGMANRLDDYGKVELALFEQL